VWLVSGLEVLYRIAPQIFAACFSSLSDFKHKDKTVSALSNGLPVELSCMMIAPIICTLWLWVIDVYPL